MSWMQIGEDVADFALSFGIKIGVTLLVLGAFVNALTGTAASTVGNIITALGNAITQLMYPIFIVAFVVIIIYLISKVSRGGKGRKN